MMTGLVDLLPFSPTAAWLPWAVQYFFLMGLSVGSLVLSLPGMAFGRASWRSASRLALVAALALGVTAPVALLADLHHPGRFLNFYLHPQASSWMSRGSFFIPLYLGGLLVYAWQALRADMAAAGRASSGPRALRLLYRRLGGPSRPALIRTGALAASAGAALIALYTGNEVAAVAARPLWHSPVLPWAFLATALMGAAGLGLALTHLAGDGDPMAARAFRRALAPLALMSLAVLGLWALPAAGGAGPAEGLAALNRSPSWRIVLWGVPILTGIALALASVPWTAGHRGTGHRGAGRWSALATGALALAAAWLFRWGVLIGGQSVARTADRLIPFRLPWGGEGLLGIAASLGLAVATGILLFVFLPSPARPATSDRKGV